MANTFTSRLRVAWNAFRNRDPAQQYTQNLGDSYGTRPDRLRLNLGNERSIVASIVNRIAIDVSEIPIQHVRIDQNGRFLETIDSGLNNCLSVEANIDQSGRHFVRDVVMMLCDEGSAAIVPVDTSSSPYDSNSYDILTLRVAKILEWYPEHVRVSLYNDENGRKEELTLAKRTVAVIENPLYTVMNEPNSTLKRLVYKLNLLDAVDEQSSSGKLDIIVQVPYSIKTPARQEQANSRRDMIEEQLKGSKYGIAYIDALEKVVQLNRPAENNLLGQITYLTNMLYSQLGLTEAIFSGTADEKEMLNYYLRTVKPIMSAVTDGIKRVFLTKTARTQGQSIMYFIDQFSLVPAATLADMADKLTRNEIVTGNEFRAIIGMRPSSDPKADELRNKNINPPSDQPPVQENSAPVNDVQKVSNNLKGE